MVDFATVGQQFVAHYYNTFDTQREVTKLILTSLPYLFLGLAV